MNQNIDRRGNFEAQTLPFLERLYRTAVYMAGSEAEAREVVVQSFVGAYRSGHSCESCPNRRARLFKTMMKILGGNCDRSAGINEDEKLDREMLDSELVTEPPTADAEQNLFATISLEDVRSALRNLPADFRLTVLLSLQEGFSYRQIARITETDLAIVRSRLHQGRRLLRMGLFDHIDERARQLENDRTGCQEANHG
ncbi:MAG: sigma factor-like helix-turn-helix DNA-binding protein [bacterium]